MRIFRKPPIYLLWIFAIGYALPGISDAVAGPADGIHYDMKTNALTVHVREMPLGEILQKIGAKSGIKFSIEADINRPVTTDLTGVPLDKAIYSLVQPNSSAMIYSTKEDGSVVLTSVKILDKGGAPRSSNENPPPLRRFNGRGDSSNPGEANRMDRLTRPGAGRTAREGTGNNQRTRSHRDADRIIQDSDSQTDDAAGSVQSALEAFSFGGMRRGR